MFMRVHAYLSASDLEAFRRLFETTHRGNKRISDQVEFFAVCAR